MPNNLKLVSLFAPLFCFSSLGGLRGRHPDGPEQVAVSNLLYTLVTLHETRPPRRPEEA